MPIIRQNQSPSVEIREQDFSQYSNAIVGTSFLINGFSSKGTNLDPIQLASMQDYTTNFGEPTNDAERYSYYTVKNVINQGGNAIFAKLPYNCILDQGYVFLGITSTSDTTATNAATSELSGSGLYEYGATKYAPISSSTGQLSCTTAEYDTVAAAGGFTAAGTFAGYDFVIVNEVKAPFAGANADEGIFAVIIDPIDGMNVQRILSGCADTDIFDILTGFSFPTTITNASMVTTLTGTFAGSSFSEDLARKFPAIEFTNNGNKLDPYYFQQLGVIVCSTSEDPQNEGKLVVSMVEAFVGSVQPTAKNPATGQSIYLGDIINSQSEYIKWYHAISSSAFSADVPPATATDTVLYKVGNASPLLGFTAAQSTKFIDGASIPSKIDTILEKVSNIDALQIDVVVDAGLSTIMEFCDENDGGTGEIFAPDTDSSTQDHEITSSVGTERWRTVCNKYINFCQNVRKDCMTILDVPRQLVLEGAQKWIRKTAPTHTFSNTIGPNLKYVTGLNSSYAALYGNWLKIIDDFTGQVVWVPETCFVAGTYAYNDRVANIWDAPAGLNRGIINGIVDLSYNPNIKEADQVYIKSINYAKQYPLDGFIVEGQKTTQVKPSALDRVNVRRLFLRLERLVYQASRYFIMEPNTAFTRQRYVDVIEPTFKQYKAAGGLYDYMIVCDETNNTAETIDRNEMHCAILLKPVKTIEWILVDFVAVKTATNFTEVLPQI